MPASAAIAVPPTPIRCTRRADAGMLARRPALLESATIERIHDQVMNLRAEVANLLIVAPRMNAIGQHRDRNFALRLDPDGSAGEAEVPDCRRRKAMPGAGMLR